MKTIDIANIFKTKLKNKEYTLDRTGCKTIEILGASFEADKPSIFGIPNDEYIQKEIHWYDTQSLNINDLDEPPPKQWQLSASPDGYINSNYGYLIFSRDNNEQYQNCFEELVKNSNSRRASMIYIRPSIWHEYNAQGKNDFICTNSVTYYIRGNILQGVVQMRSNDVVYGYKNDYAWQQTVATRLQDDLASNGLPTDDIKLHWQVQNLHVYERHFDLVK